MWRAVAVLVAVCLLGGCMTQVSDENSGDVVLLPARDALVLVDERADDAVRHGAVVFCEKLADISDGSIRVRMETSQRMMADYQVSGAEFAFFDGHTDLQANRFFSDLDAPFLYTGYEHFTMSLNAGPVLDVLTSESAARYGIRPLAAFYTGSGYLLSTVPLGDYEAFAGTWIDGEEAPEEGTGWRVLVREDRRVAAGFESLGARVSIVGDLEARTAALEERQAEVVEFAAGEWPLLDLGDREVYSARTYHSISPLWLVTDGEYFDNLAELQRAAVMEALSYVFPVIDSAYLEQEELAFLGLSDEQIWERDDFFRTRQVIREHLYHTESGTSVRDTLYAKIEAVTAL